jgi:TonB family protein
MASGTMSAGTMTGWSGTSRRRVPRFRMAAPLDVVVLRSGIPDTVPGRSLDLGERGIAAVLAGELNEGEDVGLEVRLNPETQPLRTRGMVRYQDRLKCGFEFTALTPDQRSLIREWTKEAQAKPTAGTDESMTSGQQVETKASTPSEPPENNGEQAPAPRRIPWITVAVIVALLAALFWWKWDHDWTALESGLNSRSDVKNAVQVPTDVMQNLLVHKVDPAYPLEARKQNLQAVIALDIVVGRNGSVVNVRPLNGPDILAQAAVDALRWWRFEPYVVDGKAVVAETTVAVEFKP